MRDVTLRITDRSDRAISANEYLHTRLLVTESGELTELGQCLHSLFPSLECQTLPMPSTNPKITKNMFENQEKLTPKFNAGVEGVIRRILQQVSPKLAIDGVSVVDGPTLATLARSCVEAINALESMEVLEEGWQAVIKWELQKLADKFVEEYRQEMEESLRGNLPMEERNLKRIHIQTMRRKMELLEEKVRRLNPLSTASGDRDPIFGQLEQTVCQTDEAGKVIGGVLFQFTTQNYARSKEQCEEILREIVERSEIREKCTESFITSKPLDATGLMKEVQSEYRQRAVGPAAITVLENGSESISELVDMLKVIPGPPCAVGLIGSGPDRVKLSWEPPVQNPGAVEEYEVWSKRKGKEWKRVRETKKTKILITGLKSDREYQFRIIATNAMIKSMKRTMSGHTVASDEEKIDGAALGAGFGLSCGFLALFLWKKLFDKPHSDIHTKALLGSIFTVCIAGVIFTPVSLALAPATIPVGMVWLSNKMVKEQCYRGDLDPESDDTS